jgi:DNA-directed RNA polymerase specialized sigma24 family protein
MKHKEIAKATALSQQTVKKYIHLAVASIGSYVKNKVQVLALLLFQYFF